jgi:hypothetical protein
MNNNGEPAVVIDEETGKGDIDLVFETRVSNSLFNKLMVAEFCSTFFSMLGLIFNIVKYEQFLINPERQFVFIGILNAFSTFFLIASVNIRYNIYLDWAKSCHLFTKYDNLINTGLWRLMSFEIILCSIAPYPFLKGWKYFEYV